MKKIGAFLLMFLLCFGLIFSACGRSVTVTNPDEEYSKYEQLFDYLENGDYENAHAYIHDFFGVPEPSVETPPVETQPKETEPPTVPTEPATQPTEPTTQPTEPTTQPTEPTTQPTEPTTQPTEPTTQPTEPPTQPTEPPTQPTEPATQPTEPMTEPTEPATEPAEDLVWIPKSGTKYHTKPTCSNMKDPTQVTKEEAEERGYQPCKRCH